MRTLTFGDRTISYDAGLDSITPCKERSGISRHKYYQTLLPGNILEWVFFSVSHKSV